MIDRAEAALHRLRRWGSRSGRFGRMLASAGDPVADSDAPGLLVVQIDGLSGRRLRDAVAQGRLPFLGRLLAAGELGFVPVYSGLPSTTPAVQAEFFYGTAGAVPAFTFVDHETGRLCRMYEREAASAVEARVARTSDGSLLAGGASYGNVFVGQAADARFCMASLGPGDVTPHHLRAVTPLLAVAYLPAVLRVAASATMELLTAPRDLWVGLRGGEDRSSELKFLVSRLLVGVLLRDLSVLGMEVDLARGRPVVYGNLLGYDEHAHRRGPDSALAHKALGGIDASVRRLWGAAHRSQARQYDVWVVSDHGQEATESYVVRHGETVGDAVRRVAIRLGIVAPSVADFTPVPPGGVERQRSRQLGERAIGRVVPGLDLTEVRHRPGSLAVAAQGPLGLVYLPAPLPAGAVDAFAGAVVEEAGVPMVLRRGDDPGTVVVHTESGVHRLPRDAEAVLGGAHPYRDEVAADLVALVHHPDAGDLVLSGYRAGGVSVSFPAENGAHAGPGPDETDAFALVPPGTPVGAGAAVTRPRDLRRAGFDVLAGRREPVESDRRSVRVLTYNVHGCVGMDGHLSPARIARVIARHRPDIVCLQELDVGRPRSGGVDQAGAVADALEMDLQFHPTVSVAGEQFGDAVLSRHPMRLVRAGKLPGIGLEPRGAISVEVDVPGPAGGLRTVPVINTHLSLHPVERMLAARALLGPEWLGAVDRDAVLCGDFNALAWFPSLVLLRRRLTDVQTGLDGHRPRPTWFGRFPVGRIDHVLVDRSWTVLHVEVVDGALARLASDHRPLLADLAPAPSLCDRDQGPRPTTPGDPFGRVPE